MIRPPTGQTTEEDIVNRKSPIAGLAVTLALVVGFPVGATAAPAIKKPHVGQRCSPKKKAPTGFRCVKGKTGKYHLHLHKG
jgi:hypothetical protein